MDNDRRLDEMFLRLFKVVDLLRKVGVKKMGEKNLAFLSSLTYRQERSLFIIQDGQTQTLEGIHQKDLAKELKMTIPATSVLVENLVKKDLIQRLPCSNDRRSHCLRLTPFGHETVCLIKKNIRRLSLQLTRDLSDSDKDAFIKVIDHFHALLTDREHS